MNQLESDGKWLGNLLVCKIQSTCAAKFSQKVLFFFGLLFYIIFVGYWLKWREFLNGPTTTQPMLRGKNDRKYVDRQRSDLPEMLLEVQRTDLEIRFLT